MFESDAIKHTLNVIDKVRARGIGDHISLPQLVVCGDQSAGKSSVLEGITGIPFPRNDGLCTKFATEIILRHAKCDQTITASIIPCASRNETTKSAFRAYSRSLSGYDELPDVIDDVAKRLGLKGFTEAKYAPAFAADVLRIEVTGDTGLHLTIVDLPGLIEVSDDEEDVDIVAKLVDSYLESSRTIILAVLPAPIDIENQKIIRRARHFDRSGERTVGILTKPDLINQGTEGKIVQLLQNEGPTKLKLGFFLLKNPDPQALKRGISLAERKAKELQFFQDPVWAKLRLNLSRIGIDTLRTFLQALLETHIEKELPKVRSDVRALLLKTKNKLDDLGEERHTILEQRLYLSKLSGKFSALTQSAIDGTYQNRALDFFSEEHEGALHNRLRAHIHRLNSEFAEYMRTKSFGRQITNPKDNASQSAEPKTKDPAAENRPDSSSPQGESSLNEFDTLEAPEFVSKEEYHDWVMKTYRNTRGLELPGNYSYNFLMELFHKQSRRWPAIARRHIETVHRKVSDFFNRVLEHTVSDEHVRSKLLPMAKAALRETLNAALGELEKICEEEQIQPITYNHYFTDNVQKGRHEKLKAIIQEAADALASGAQYSHHNNQPRPTAAQLLAPLQKRVEVDMDRQACEEARSALDAYYKVAMKTFVDNVCRQVIERHIVSKLPAVLDLATIHKFSDEDIQRIAAEPATKTKQRKELANLASMLAGSLDDLQEY